jgi:malonyl CoA-acyl carrier protein transacylase/acyl carrier protein
MLNIEKKAYHGKAYDFEWRPFAGSDYSRKAFLFPGQGAAVPGMFSFEYRKLPEFREVFVEADRFAAKMELPPVSHYLLNHDAIPSDVLPMIRNLALFCAEVAIFNCLVKKGVQPRILTGHSFGEYAVFCCAGVIDFQAALEIVYRREVFSPGVNVAGAMLAVSAGVEEFTALPHIAEFEIANINSPKQIVISLPTHDFRKMNDFLKKQRIAARPLETVGRPYHSRWLEPTRQRFSAWLRDYEFSVKPNLHSIVSSVSGAYYPAGRSWDLGELRGLFADQLIRPVNFIHQIQTIKAQGVSSFLELGPTSIYSGFVKATLTGEDVQTAAVSAFLNSNSSRSERQRPFAVDVTQSPFYGVVYKYIGQITGYETKDISFQDDFQEDLQIDSIKKAEIIFKALEGANLFLEDTFSISQMRRVGDIVQYLDQLKVKGEKSILSGSSSKSSFFALKSALCKAPGLPAPRAAAASMSIRFVKINSGFTFEDDGLKKFVTSASTGEIAIVVDIDAGLTQVPSVNWLSQLFLYFGSIVEAFPGGRQDFQVLIHGRTESPLFSGLVAFFKSFAKEVGHFTVKSLVSIDSSDEMIKAVLSSDSLGSLDFVQSGPDLFYRAFRQAVPHHLPLKSPRILSVGGSRGILKEIYSRFPKELRAELFIVGRTKPEDLALKKTLGKISKRFKKVEYFQVDAENFEALEEVAKKIAAQGKIDCLVNASGREVSQLLLERTAESINAELISKLRPFENLLKIKEEIGIEKFINFSSIVSAFGNEGQAPYCFSNAYTSQFGGVVHLHWPAMERMGMTENVGILQKLRSTGISFMDGQFAADFFMQALSSSATSGSLYFLTPKDVLLFNLGLQDHQALLSVLGYLSNPAELTFKKVFNIKTDSYLQDHRVESTFVVPAATGLSAFLSLGRLYFGQWPTLSDVSILNMIVANERDNVLQTSVEWLSPEQMSIRLFSSAEHYKGLLSPPPVSEASEQGARAFKSFVDGFAPQLSVDMGTFYSVRSIDYGPKFQMIKSAWVDDAGETLVLARSDAPYLSGHGPTDFISSLIELCFHAIYLKGMLSYRGLGIPVQVGQIRVFASQCMGKIFVKTTIDHSKSQRGSRVVGSASVFSGDGQLLLEIADVMMSMIRNFETVPFDLKAVTRAVHESV